MKTKKAKPKKKEVKKETLPGKVPGYLKLIEYTINQKKGPWSIYIGYDLPPMPQADLDILEEELKKKGLKAYIEKTRADDVIKSYAKFNYSLEVSVLKK